MNKRKVIVRTKYQYSLNNPDGKFSNAKHQKKYVNDMLDYFSDIKKKAVNMIDYYTGKINKNEDINLILENGKFATKEELYKRKKFISKKIQNSNLWQIVISFDNDYIDKNITLENLEQKMAKEIIPKFLKKIGFEDINKICYQMSLHTNTKNYHFHISFLEKQPNYRDYNNNLNYRRTGKIPQKAINFLKQETCLSIEREQKFRPMIIETNKEIDKLKKYFNKNSYNFILKDIDNLLLEQDFIKLGKLLTDRLNLQNTKIKYNSIKNDEIKQLTKKIKKYLFTSKEIKSQKDKIDNCLNDINKYLLSLAKDNKISKSNIDKSIIKMKEKYIDNYVLNAIVNHAKESYLDKRGNSKITIDTIIKEIIIKNYKKTSSKTKKDFIKNYSNSNKKNRFINAKNINQALKNINHEMEKATKYFDELFNNKDIDIQEGYYKNN